jgi:predicted permease
MTQWNTWGVMGWFFLFFTCLSYEIWTGINHAERTPMLTQVVVRYIPAPFTLVFIAWLFFHFLVRYLNPKYVQWLKSGGAGG